MTDVFRPAPLRTLTSTDAPYAGELLGSDPPTVWTNAELWENNPGWRADPDGHVLAPTDAGRDSDGGGVIIAHCTERLADAIARREDLHDGEAITVAVSLLRGSAEAEALGAEFGSWWLTSEGRPVLATVGSVGWREETRQLLAALAQHRSGPLAGALESATQLLSSPWGLRRDAAATEDLLFASGKALPLSTHPVALRARVLAPALRTTTSDDRTDLDPPTGVLRGHLDPGMVGRLHEIAARWAPGHRRTGSPSPPRAAVQRPSQRHSRRRPVVVALSVAAVIVSAGALWPDAPSAPVASVSPAAPRASTPPPTATQEPERHAAADQDVAGAAAALMADFARCASRGCGAEVVEDPSRPLAAAALGDAGGSVTVLDDYGGVAVIRVGGEPGPIAVIVKVHEKWLVRDIYDAADQP